MNTVYRSSPKSSHNSCWIKPQSICYAPQIPTQIRQSIYGEHCAHAWHSWKVFEFGTIHKLLLLYKLTSVGIYVQVKPEFNPLPETVNPAFWKWIFYLNKMQLNKIVDALNLRTQPANTIPYMLRLPIHMITLAGNSGDGYVRQIGLGRENNDIAHNFFFIGVCSFNIKFLV